jgi:lysophospholipase L1-like esterase
MIWLSSVNSDPAASGNAARQPISPKRRMGIYRVLLSLAGLLISLMVAEGALRLVEKMQLGDRAIENKLINDPMLGLKLAPYTQGHDANGFRNDAVSQHVDIVALGDSQTWGVNVAREDAWPQQLSTISGRSVYNMALGGFGPVQYRILIPEALRLSPKIIVVGFYLGNDIYDAYKMAYQYEAHRGLRSSKVHDLSVDTVGLSAHSFWNEEKQFHHNFGRSSFSGLSFWLREHLALGRLLNRTGLWPGSQDIDYEIDKRWAMEYPDHGAVCEEPGRETVLTTAYRLAGLDIDEPRNAEGLRIAKQLLAQIQNEVDAKQVKLMVLLLPTKETVYATAQSGKMGGKIGNDPTYQKLVEMERRVRSEMLTMCQAERIQCIDTLPYLTDALDRGERLYPTTTESHPNARGYLVVASAVNENLGKLGL